MAIFTLTDAIIWAHDLDATGNTNKVTVKTATDDKEANVFGMVGGYKQRVAGYESVEIDTNGYADTTAVPDASIFGGLGVADRVITVAPTSPAGSTAYFCQAADLTYEHLGTAGDVAPFTFTAKGSNKAGLLRGNVGQGKGSVSATGPLGSGLNLGAVGAGQSLYVAFHAFAVGTTANIQVQSDTTSGFGAPTVRGNIASAALTATGGYFLQITGPITDTWWRFNVFSITGSFTVAGSMAIR